MKRVIVIGPGNPFRGDDAAGIEVARRIRDAAPPGVDVRIHGADPIKLLDVWSRADVVFLVDALAASGASGTIHRHEAAHERLPDRPRRDSTHVVGLGELIELARALGRLPERVVVIGIQGSRFNAGDPLSPEVAAAVAEVADAIAREAASVNTEEGAR